MYRVSGWCFFSVPACVYKVLVTSDAEYMTVQACEYACVCYVLVCMWCVYVCGIVCCASVCYMLVCVVCLCVCYGVCIVVCMLCVYVCVVWCVYWCVCVYVYCVYVCLVWCVCVCMIRSDLCYDVYSIITGACVVYSMVYMLMCA